MAKGLSCSVPTCEYTTSSQVQDNTDMKEKIQLLHIHTEGNHKGSVKDDSKEDIADMKEKMQLLERKIQQLDTNDKGSVKDDSKEGKWLGTR